MTGRDADAPPAAAAPLVRMGRSLRAARAECMRVAREAGPGAALARAAAILRHAAEQRAPRLARLGTRPPARRDGTLFVGYLDAALGLGESLRGLVRSIDHQAMPFALHPITAGVEDRALGPFMPSRRDTAGRYDITVIEVAADQLPHVCWQVRHRRLESSYTILRTYWELSRVPPAWGPLLHGIDEIWAPTRFVADAFAGVFRGPVTIVPPCVDVAGGRASPSADLGLARQGFHFMFSFDYQSSPVRKNPLGVVRAFQAAFPGGPAEVGLLIKSTGLPPPHLASDDCRMLWRALQAAAAADRRIRVVDRVLTREEMLGLIEWSDCYVSLHRSEGFGLGMAEAMALGTAVIGTDYSGSREFLTGDTGFPVACSLRPVGAGEYPHHHDQVWAQPDEDDAIAAMRRAVHDPAEVRRRSSAARVLVADRYGSRTVGGIAGGRIGQVMDVIRKAKMA